MQEISGKALLVINPVAGKMHAKGALFNIIEPLCEKNFSVNVAITQKRGHAAKLAEDAAKNGFDTVICCGGDGTLNEVITGFLKSGRPLPLGYIPMGSTNDFARTLELPTDPAEAASRIAEKRPRKIDIGSFNEKSYFSYIASFGAFTNASYEAPQELKNTLGHFAYIVSGIKSLSEIKARRVRLKAAGREYKGNYMFCAVANTRSVGGMIRLRPELFNLSDGLFEVLLIKKPRTPADLNLILTSITNSSFDNRMFDFLRAGDMTFYLSDDVDWTLDGEKAKGAREVRIRALHSAITLYI